MKQIEKKENKEKRAVQEMHSSFFLTKQKPSADAQGLPQRSEGTRARRKYRSKEAALGAKCARRAHYFNS